MTQSVLLGDLLADLAMGPFGSNLKVDNFIDSGVPVVKGGNLYGYEVGGEFSFVSEEKAQSLKRSLAYPDDIIITHRGTLGQVSIVPRGKYPYYLASQSQLRMTVNKDEINPRYLLYYLRSSTGQYELMQHAAQVGVPSIATPTKAVKSLKILLPDLKTQQKIVDILGTIDEKIELNRKMNETLEQMGQALFRHYFINDPSSENLTVGDIAEVIDCLHSKKPEKVDFDTGNILLQLNNIKDNGILDLTDRYYISNQDYAKWISRIEASENDFVITNVGRSGAVAKIPSGVKAALGRNMTGIRLKPEANFPGFMSFLLNSSYMKSQIESRLDHGTILAALNVKNIPKLLLPVSDTGIVSQHEQKFTSIRDMIEANIIEVQTLTSLRDTLLPRLLNGKVKFSG